MGPLPTAADEIDRLSRRLVRSVERCDRVLAARCRLTAAQVQVLQVLEEAGEVAMNGLAEEMRLHGTTMTRIVDGLVAKGLVVRAADARDRRVVRVMLTAGGVRAVGEVQKSRRDSLLLALRGVSEEEVSAMAAGARSLASLAERWGATPGASASDGEPDAC